MGSVWIIIRGWCNTVDWVKISFFKPEIRGVPGRCGSFFLDGRIVQESMDFLN